MLNSEIKDRILNILREENLSSSKFADILDVQRSSISHIISGRNKPSLDFIQKVLKNFPSISPDWLIIGKGEMYLKTEQQEFDFDSPPVIENEKKVEKNSDSIKIENNSSDSMNIVNNVLPKVKNIERIIVFFDNGTFEELKPGKGSKK
jgi:plasmid maintenance system antidote protein VapI